MLQISSNTNSAFTDPLTLTPFIDTDGNASTPEFFNKSMLRRR